MLSELVKTVAPVEYVSGRPEKEYVGGSLGVITDIDRPAAAVHLSIIGWIKALVLVTALIDK